MITKSAILSYLDRGKSVFPINPKNKKPYFATMPFLDRLATEDEVERWLKDYPDMMLAMATGAVSGETVIDVDTNHGGITNDPKYPMPMGPIARTPSGGYHFHCQFAAGVPGTPGLLKGIDIRNWHQYAIMPPSTREDGVPYTWQIAPEDAELPPLPEWVWQLSKDKKHSKVKSQDFIGKLEGQNRNDELFRMLCSMVGKGDEDQTIWLYAQATNQLFKDPLSETELNIIFTQAIGYRHEKEGEGGFPENPVYSPSVLTEPLTFQQIKEKVDVFLPNSEVALKIVLAVTAAALYDTRVMLWVLLVGVPSSGKTDVVRLVKDFPATYYLDNMTLNSFISGERETEKNKVHDLLPQLNNKCFVIKDWTSIFSLDERMTKKLLGDLVGIYDKEFTKFSSARGKIDYTTIFSHLGCVTPATLNKHTAYINTVGPRFLFYTMPSTSDEEDDTSYNQLFSAYDRSLAEKEARLYVSSYLSQIVQEDLMIVKEFSDDVKTYLKIASKVLANCRGYVLLRKSSFMDEDKVVEYYEILEVQIEKPWRAVQQLMELTRLLTFVTQKTEAGVDELEIIKQVVVSCMPADRAMALQAICEHTLSITVKELSDELNISSSSARRLLDELTALRVLKRYKQTGSANTYQLADRFEKFFRHTPRDFLETPPSDDSRHEEPVNSEKKVKINIENADIAWEEPPL